MLDHAFVQFRAGLPSRDRVVLDAMVDRLRSVAQGLGNGALLKRLQQAMPSLDPGECQALMTYALAGASNDFGPTASRGASASSSDNPFEQTKRMQETQMSFNLQYLQLQSQMQHENRAYTAVSNIMKTKHDTVKNSISNIR